MEKNLVIVESPAKAKTIEKFLGKDYVVKSCNGHVRDLPKHNISIDIKNRFTPVYVTIDEKKAIVAALKKEIKKVEGLYLATDDDREGEAISWHLCHALGLDVHLARRIVFREVTEKSVTEAIKNPRALDLALVGAQQARRVLDRIVGFELSPLLWKKIKRGLSAGRVQSVAVRLIVENERKIASFKQSTFYQSTFLFKKEQTPHTFSAKLSAKHTEAQARDLLERCRKAHFTVATVHKKQTKRKPPVPLTTSYLVQEAHRQFGYATGRTMRYAQGLYESGKITYMRTDSIHLSQEAIAAAKRYIIAAFGAEYSQPVQYKGKGKGKTQEAHEAIRPTDFSVAEAGESHQERQLYKLIRNRTLASQMAPALLDRTVVEIKASTGPEVFVAQGELMVFEGFTKLYGKKSNAEDEQSLPPLKQGDRLLLEEGRAKQCFTRPPARYSEASLVKELEEMGIGRPSTYAPTIETIQRRNYVRKETREGKERTYTLFRLRAGSLTEHTEQERYGEEKNKLFSTSEANVVTDFLCGHFSKVLDYSFTATLEEALDAIAAGRVQWQEVVEQFYADFHPQVEAVVEQKEIESKTRLLGKDPKTKRNVYVRLGRFGPYAQLGEPDDKQTKSSSLQDGQFIDTITLAEALRLFELPRTLEDWQGTPLIVSVSRYGPYAKHGEKFYSLDKTHDPYTISHAAVIAHIEQKIKEEKQRVMATFVLRGCPVEVLRGRFGPYIRHDGKNYKIPKAQQSEAEHLTPEACEEIIKKAPAGRGKRR